MEIKKTEKSYFMRLYTGCMMYHRLYIWYGHYGNVMLVKTIDIYVCMTYGAYSNTIVAI